MPGSLGVARRRARAAGTRCEGPPLNSTASAAPPPPLSPHCVRNAQARDTASPPCKCVRKMASRRESRKDLAARARCCVPSPQSTNHAAPLCHRMPVADTLRERDGACAAVPNTVRRAGPDMLEANRMQPRAMSWVGRNNLDRMRWRPSREPLARRLRRPLECRPPAPAMATIATGSAASAFVLLLLLLMRHLFMLLCADLGSIVVRWPKRKGRNCIRGHVSELDLNENARAHTYTNTHWRTRLAVPASRCQRRCWLGSTSTWPAQASGAIARATSALNASSASAQFPSSSSSREPLVAASRATATASPTLAHATAGTR